MTSRSEAEKNNPFSKLSQNETAAQLYKMGAFNPETASQALIMLSMMDFEGKEEIVQKVSEAAGRYSVSTEPGDNESLPVSYPETLLKEGRTRRGRRSYEDPGLSEGRGHDRKREA